MKRRALAVLAVAALAAVTTSSAAGQHRQRAACPSAAQVASLPLWKSGGVLRGDVTGDGKPDAVSVRFDTSAPARCAFFLRVTSAKRDYTLRLGGLVAGLFGKLEWNAPVAAHHAGPVVDAIVDLGGHGNLVALMDNQGASDDFVDFVGVSHGRLRVIRMGLDFGGSVMSQHGASCSRAGVLRTWDVFATSSGKRWGLSVEAYRRHGWRITRVAHTTTHGSQRAVWRSAKRTGVVGGKPLAGCSVARNPGFDG